MWTKWQDKMPPVEQVVLCRIYYDTDVTKLQEVELIHVAAEDHTWVTADDRSELNEWSWTVLDWKYLD